MSSTNNASRRGNRRPPQEFHLPDGRKVVVAMPDDVVLIREQYAALPGTRVLVSVSSVVPDGVAASGSMEGGKGNGNAEGRRTRKEEEKRYCEASTREEGDVEGKGERENGGEGEKGMNEVETCPEDERAQDDDDDDATPCENDIHVEIVVHGSDEHLSHLTTARTHHETRRQRLRERHGPAFDEWEAVQRDLDSVDSMLDRAVDRGAALSESFSKFGYDAHLRTYDDREGMGGGSEMSSRTGGSNGNGSDSGSGSGSGSEGREWEDQRSGEGVRLFKRPVIKQYFHRGLLWRSGRERAVASFELFFDLLYVGIIHINGEHVSEDATGAELLRFAVTFIMSWKIWADLTHLVSWFETDDVLSRAQVLFIFACLLGFTTNMINCFNPDPEHNTYAMLVGFYLANRFFQAAYCALNAVLLPLVRGVMIAHSVITILPAALWVASIHVSIPARLGLIWSALVADLFGHVFLTALFAYARSGIKRGHLHAPEGAEESGKVPRPRPGARQLAKWFEFFPAVNIEHKVERTNAFVALVFGWSVISVLFQNYSSFGLNAYLGKAILGLCQAFVFNWLYFDVDGANLHVHAIRRGAFAAGLWGYMHLPFIMGYILASAGLHALVLASDYPGADSQNLYYSYAAASEDVVPTGIRYFYCHGLAIALLCMGAISWSNTHKKPRLAFRMPKVWRLANRAFVCVIMFLLPLAGPRLNSLELIGTTLGLVVWVLVVELYGMNCRGSSFWPRSDGRGGCSARYSARCGRRELEDAAKRGGEVGVTDELEKGEKKMAV